MFRKIKIMTLFCVIGMASCATFKYAPDVARQTDSIKTYKAWETANPPADVCKADHDKLVAIVKDQGALILKIMGKKEEAKK